MSSARNWLTLAALAALATACSNGSDGPSDDPCASSGVGSVQHDLVYQDLPGVSPRERTLDIYLPARAATCPAMPIMVWVHGGNWAGGDKLELGDSLAAKVTGRGIVLASVNYRLSSAMYTEHVPPVTWPTHANDVARAIAFVRAQAPTFNGDPDRIILSGFSAGAQVVANLGTDSRYLETVGFDRDIIACTLSLDVGVYDVPQYVLDHPDPGDVYEIETIFGADRGGWILASATLQVHGGPLLAPFLVVRRTPGTRLAQIDGFIAALRGAGGVADPLDAFAIGHDDVNWTIGLPSDSIMWPAIERFLERRCGT